MIGGRSLKDKCNALLLRSGDIIVMSGVSRLCYHAVPRILEARCHLPLPPSYQEYINKSRINMNIRQVLQNGVTHLNV